MSTKKNLHLCCLMDCERVARYAPDMGGPASWDLSERAIRGFSKIILDRGLKGSFGIHPETAYQHRELFLELADERVELYLQFHAGNFRGLEYPCYLGFYSRQDQMDIVGKAREDWIRAIGWAPKTYGAGGISINDSTWIVLYELGFRQATFLPERYYPKVSSVTVSGCPFPHHADARNRLVPGDLELYLIPVTINWRRGRWAQEAFSPIDLRPEGGVDLDAHRDTIDQNIEKMLELDIPIKVIFIPTHNTQEYSDPENKVRRILEETLEYVVKAAETNGLNLVPATFEEVHLAAHGGKWPWEGERELYRKWQRSLKPGEGYDVTAK